MGARSGGPAVFISKQFKTNKTDFDAIIPAHADVTGYDAVLAAFLADTTNWAPLPEVDQDLGITYLEESEDITPLNVRHRTSDVVTLAGVDTISFGYPRRDNAEIARFLAAIATTVTVAAGADQVGQTNIELGAGFRANTYNHLAMIYQEESGFYMLDLFHKVRAVGAVEMTYGHTTTRIPAVFKCFTHTGTGFDSNDGIGIRKEMTAVATS